MSASDADNPDSIRARGSRQLLSSQNSAAAIAPLPLGVWHFSSADNLIRGSDSFFDLLGLPRQTPLELHDALALLTAEDAARLHDAACHAVTADDEFALEVQRVTKLDRHQSLLVHGRTHHDAAPSATVQLTGLIIDVSELRQAESSLRASEAVSREIISSWPAHVAVIATDGTILATNEAWQSFAATNAALELGAVSVGANYLDVCRRASATDPVAQSALKGIGDVLSGKVRSFSQEYECSTPTDQSWYLMTVRPFGTPHTKGAIISHADISLRRRMATALAKAQSLSVASRMALAISHDFGNALSIISGHLQILQQHATSEATHKSASAAMQAVTKAGTLVRRLASLTDNRDIEPAMELRLGSTLAALVDKHAKPLRHARVTLAEPSPQLWPVYVSKAELEGILESLLRNADEAMAGPGTIDITLDNAELHAEAPRALSGAIPGAYVRVRITDSGAGMSDEVLRHCCEPFYTTKSAQGHAGLGLTNVCMATERAAGFVAILSKPDAGTTVEIYLPRPRPHVTQHNVPAPSP